METNQMINKAGERLADVSNKARDLKNSTSELARRASSTMRDAGAAADLYLHQYAWTTTAVVALIAGTVGFFIGSSRRRW